MRNVTARRKVRLAPSLDATPFRREPTLIPPQRLSDSVASMAHPSATRLVTIVNPQGIHLWPADLFVKTAQRFQATVEVIKGNERFDGRSVLSLLTTAAVQGTQLTLSATGPDAEAAVAALAEVVARGFDEMESVGG